MFGTAVHGDFESRSGAPQPNGIRAQVETSFSSNRTGNLPRQTRCVSCWRRTRVGHVTFVQVYSCRPIGFRSLNCGRARNAAKGQVFGDHSNFSEVRSPWRDFANRITAHATCVDSPRAHSGPRDAGRLPHRHASRCVDRAGLWIRVRLAGHGHYSVGNESQP